MCPASEDKSIDSIDSEACSQDEAERSNSNPASEMSNDFVLEDASDDEVLAGVGSERADDAEASLKEISLREMRLEARIEALVFAAQKPLKAAEIHNLLRDESLSLDDVQKTLGELVEFYANRSGGFCLKYIKRLGYQFQTDTQAGPLMERMFASRPRPISRAALETLSIIAYRQPVTRAEVEFIRGVDVGSIFKSLMERELVKCVGRKEVPGRPMLFGTTDEFLKVFNLGSLGELPPLSSFQPSHDTMQNVRERFGEDGAPDDAPVDVERYISDHVDSVAEASEVGGREGTDEDIAPVVDGSEGQAQRIEGAVRASIEQPSGPDDRLATEEQDLTQQSATRNLEQLDDS